jgi:hypothetical protein
MMAMYKPFRPIEYNQHLYLLAAMVAATPAECALRQSSGRKIPVDASGFIEMNDWEAGELRLGQIKLWKVIQEFKG